MDHAMFTFSPSKEVLIVTFRTPQFENGFHDVAMKLPHKATVDALVEEDPPEWQSHATFLREPD